MLMVNNMSTLAPKRIRFTADDDIELLREVFLLNPMRDNTKWIEVQEAVNRLTGKCFSVRCLKDHLCLLLEMWNKKNSAKKERCDIEEVYNERDNLLQEITDICQEFEIKPTKNKVVSRGRRLINLGEHRPSNNVRQDALQFLQQRTLRDNSMRKRELELEERKVALEEKKLKLEEEKFLLEKEERALRLELEKDRFLFEKNNTNNLDAVIRQQLALMELLMKKFDP